LLLLFVSVFSELFETNFNPVSFYKGIEFSLKLFLIDILEILVGSFWKQSINTLWVPVGGPFESRVPTHCSCCSGPLWKQSTYTVHYSCCWGTLWKQRTYILQLLLGHFWRQSYLIMKKMRNLRAKHL